MGSPGGELRLATGKRSLNDNWIMATIVQQRNDQQEELLTIKD